MKMKSKYKVTIRRVEHREHVFEVEADSKDEAHDLGLEASFEHDFNESPVHHADEDVVSVVKVD